MIARVRLLLVAAFATAVLLAALVLFFFYPEILRVHVLVPLIQAYFISRFYLEFVPQIILWLVPPAIVLLIMGRRFVRWSRQGRPTRHYEPTPIAPGEGELARLAHQVHRAHTSRFARVRLSRTLVEIGARLIAGREGMALQRARQELQNGYWRDSASIQQFLTPRRHYTLRQSETGFEDTLQEVIEHLEQYGDYG